MNKLSKLSILPANKTVVFYSPAEGRDVLVRTGITGGKNSFIHALMHAYSKEYPQMEAKKRVKLVEKFRDGISEKLNRKQWEDASASLPVKITFQENINKILADVYRSVEKNKKCKTEEGTTVIKSCEKNKEVYKIMTELVSLDTFSDEILSKAYDECSEEPIEKCKEIITNTSNEFIQGILNGLGRGIERERKRYCLEKMNMLIEKILSEAENKSYKNYSSNLKKSLSVDSFAVGLLADRFKRDIYFFDSKTRMPYMMGETKNRKSLIVMWHGGEHYEIVGKLLPGHRVQREFSVDDHLIKRISTFLYHPERVPEQYPNLISYLPKTEEKARKKSKSETRSESRSETRSETRSESRSSEHSSRESDSGSKSDSVFGKSPVKKPRGRR